MSANPVKCQNCGAMLMQNEEKTVLFCPFCGTELPKEDGLYEYSRFVLQHNEEVRQRKAKEKGKQERTMWIVMGILFALIVCYFASQAIRHNTHIRELEALRDEIVQDIAEGRYDKAEEKLVLLRVTDNYSNDDIKVWDEQREELQKLVKKKR